MTSIFSKFRRQKPGDISKVIMGLGNPGITYANNRHNFGFMVIDYFVETRQLHFRSGGRSYLWCEAPLLTNRNICLSKPLTYMNKSGVAARQLLSNYNLSPERLLVIYDDIDLPLGRIRLRKSGSAGGHNGIKSIEKYLQSRNFPRLRLGIGPQNNGVPSEEFVLKDFRQPEKLIADKIIALSAEIILDYFSSDIDSIMNKYNNIDLRETKPGDA